MCGEETGKRNISGKPVALLTSEFASLFRIASLSVIIAIFNKWPLAGEAGSYQTP